MEFEIGTYLKKEDGIILHRMTTTDERANIAHKNNTSPSLLRSIINGNRRITKDNIQLLKDLKEFVKERNKEDSIALL